MSFQNLRFDQTLIPAQSAAATNRKILTVSELLLGRTTHFDGRDRLEGVPLGGASGDGR